ncbi:MAG: C1 family peptidase [Clostridiales bacterium]|nr:C1 family peptidase [Clostridiales bacterium]
MNAITSELLSRYEKETAVAPGNRMARHTLSKCKIEDAAFVQEAAQRLRHKFSCQIETLPVTNQKSSGRCWLFAATNLLRERIAKARGLEQFELSQSYLAFWDKFERSNYFLESILATRDLPHDDRTVMFILQTGVHDGGQWDMFANIVRKYGIVPKDVFDETQQSSNTRRMNYLLNRYMKRCAAELRRHSRSGANEIALQAEKETMLGKVYDFLTRCYGEPPKRFNFEFVDKDKTYHVEENLTPLSFAERTLALQLLDETVSIIHAPTSDKPFDATYTIRFLGNVADGRAVRHLNLRLDDFKAAVLAQLQSGYPVWFGSDVGHDGDRELGLWDDALFDYETLTGLPLDISKEDGLDYCFSAMDHAMVLTGVQLEQGRPVRWRIENSWGDEHGQKGYYICSDSWFGKYVYQAAVERRFLGEKAALYEKEPVVLDPWDPMGTLAE